MGLTTAINIGRSGLLTSQIGIQTVGNNLANAATPGYSRQTTLLEPARDQNGGAFTVGRGVQVDGIRRQVDEAIQARLRASLGDEAAASERFNALSQLETVLGELTEFDLSSELNTFFNSWSDAANLQQSQSVIVGAGVTLAEYMRGLRADLDTLRGQIELQIDRSVTQADQLLSEVASINASIAGSELAGADANALRDRRDVILNELAAFLDISVVEDPRSGAADVFVGSVPVVIGAESRGLQITRESDGSETTARIELKKDGTPLPLASGSIGGLLEARDSGIDEVRGTIDTLASQLIFEVNRLHATGSNLEPHSLMVSERIIPTSDRSVALNSTSNGTFSSLPFSANNGGFFVEVTNASGQTTRTRIDVDLDNITSSGVAGPTDDTSPEDIVNALNAVAGVNASFDANGRVRVESDPGFTFAFSEDTSGALAVLGLGGFFSGRDGRDIAVNADIQADPSGVNLGGQTADGFTENATALGIVALGDEPVDSLGGVSFRDFWQNRVQSVAVASSSASTAAQAGTIVRESVEAQRASVSGVSTDEESINLITFQRQFQGAARVISAADELLQTLINIV
ncbi:MAG: flagellar hook-associated protein FlgK [Planctomycetota bacterium]